MVGGENKAEHGNSASRTGKKPGSHKIEELSMKVPWVIEEHTLVKHALLNRYIRRWMAIFFRTQEKYKHLETVFYFDGFAGPGLYYSDQTRSATCDGSPIIVAKATNEYIERKPSRQVAIFCIDKDQECTAILSDILKELNKFHQLWKVFHATFDQTVNNILDEIEKQKLTGCPMFFFIDPFGYSGYPLSTIRRIMAYPRSEALINFMVYDIIRFAAKPQMRPHLLALFGSEDYLRYKDASTAERRQAFLLNQYCGALRKTAKADFVMPFRINTAELTNRPRYYLIHASRNAKALRVMKDAMWQESESPYCFEAIGLNTDQMSLFEDADKVGLRERILDFCRQTRSVPFEEVESWAYAYTNGVSKTIKAALLNLERVGQIRIRRQARQRKATVAKGARIIYDRKR
jgi:three-Cys-motif partner protein